MPKRKNTGESENSETTMVETPLSLPDFPQSVGLSIPEDTPLDEWAGQLHRLQDVKRHFNAYLGDLIAFGRRKYGDYTVDETLKQMEFNFAEVRKSEAIGNVPVDKRNEFKDLDQEHFFVVGKHVEGKKEQTKWLKSAEKNKLSGRELQLSIEAGEVVKNNTSTETTGRGSGGFITIQGIVHELKSWREQVNNGWEKWTVKQRKEFLDQTEEFANFRNEVSMTLVETNGE